MSKKSRDRCDSDTDTETTTTYGRSRASNSIKSTLSSTRDECLAGPSGDYEFSACSSTLSSTCSSPYRSNYSVDDPEVESNFDTNPMYLDNLSMHKKEQNFSEVSEPTISSKLRHYESFLSQSRRTISAPTHASRRLHTNSCKLQRIDENEEQCCGSSVSPIASGQSSKKSQKDMFVKWDTVNQEEELTKLTPRCIEVPPKKMCIRQKTPELTTRTTRTTRTTDMPQELKARIGDSWKGDGNRRFSIGDKEFILRKVNKTGIVCVSTQTKDAAVEETNYDHSDSDAFQTRCSSIEAANVWDTDQAKQALYHTMVCLPQSVDETDSQPITLEPNIIIIDSDEEKPKRKRRNTRVGAIGDMSSDSGNLSMKKYENKEGMDNASKKIMGNAIKPFEHSIPSRSCTPTYVMSTIYSDSTLQSSKRNSEIFSAPGATPRYHSNTEVIEREIRTINPETSDTVNFEKFSESLCEVFDVSSYKTILMDYSAGIKPSRTFPIHFDDLEALETKAEEPNSVGFKQKASEYLQFASSKVRQLNMQLNQLKITTECERRSQTSRNASIIDMRKNQQINLDYYLVGSSSESSIISEQEGVSLSPGVKPEEIQWELEENRGCCSCFGSLRLM